MTKLIIYIISIFFTGVMFFYIAILWNKGVSYIHRMEAKKLQPEINAFVNRYIECGALNKTHNKNKHHELQEITNDTLQEEKIIIQQIKSFIKKPSRRNLVENSLFSYENSNDKVTKEAIINLAEETGLVKGYVRDLHLKDHHKVAEAVEKLGRIGSKSANKYLIKVLKRGNTFESYNTLLALAKTGDEEYFIEAFNYLEGIEYLTDRSIIHIIDSFQGDLSSIYCKMINHSNSDIVSLFIKSASNALHVSNKKLNDGTVNYIKNNIVHYLKSDNIELKIATIKFLGELKDQSFIDLIGSNLNDGEWVVRAITAKVLGNFRDGAQGYLLKSLKDSVWTVRYNSAISLMNSKDYIKYVDNILSGNDKFAKDIIIAILDNAKKIDKIDNSSIKRKIAHHIESKKGND
ncbi:HEAT repeat domain-containing protein [Clostridium sp.]|uniref:HEAT repeat domain-containing protein n=1 Tax=Clostridium sp. TaxID=1506 RepID=UPI002FCB8D3F